MSTGLENKLNQILDNEQDCLDLSESILSTGGDPVIVEPIYTRLKFLQTDGNQWIDTGVQCTEKTCVTLDMLDNGSDAWSTFMGDNSVNLQLQITNNNTFDCQLYNQSKNMAMPTRYDTYSSLIEFNTLDKKVCANNENKLTGYTGSLRTPTQNIHLFTHNGATGGHAKVTFNEARIRKATTGDWKLIREFIPVKDSNNVVCLYDRVTRQFFYNQGTGSFTAGDPYYE